MTSEAAHTPLAFVSSPSGVTFDEVDASGASRTGAATASNVAVPAAALPPPPPPIPFLSTTPLSTVTTTAGSGSAFTPLDRLREGITNTNTDTKQGTTNIAHAHSESGGLSASSVTRNTAITVPPSHLYQHPQTDEEDLGNMSLSMTMEGEVTLAERTLVDETHVSDEKEGKEEDAEEDEKMRKMLRHVKGPSSSSLRRAQGKERGHVVQRSVEGKGDPLRMPAGEEKEKEREREKERLEEEAVGKDGCTMHFVDGDDEMSRATATATAPALAPVSAMAKRASHLRLDIKPPSPMPWDKVQPPPDNNLKVGTEYYSPSASQKFRTLQSTGSARPLVPKSSYYFGPPPPDSAFGTAPVGQIGVHHPREIIRIERDYTGGELIQFAPIYPLELEGRLTPTHFLESINAINEVLISAYSLRHSMLDNMLAIFSLQISKLFIKTHFEKEMLRLRTLIEEMNRELYNPVGLNMLWPQNVAFLYLEIEYY